MFCRNCGSELVKGVCPNCSKFEHVGNSEIIEKKNGKEKNGFRIIVFIVIFILVVEAIHYLWSIGCFDNLQRQNEVEYKYVATDLLDIYEQNPLAADEKYRGKFIEISGLVVDIDSEFLTNDIYISIGENKLFSIEQCQCFFSSADKVMNLKIGDYVKVVGKVGDYDSTFDILELYKCEIITNDMQ